MDPVTLAAILPILGLLGDALPGMLVAGVALYVYRQREKEWEIKRIEWQKCETERAEEYKEILDKMFAQIDATNSSLNSIAINLAAKNRDSQIGERLDTIVQQIQTQEVRGSGNAERRQGQAGRKAG
jgi:hypothetical protein